MEAIIAYWIALRRGKEKAGFSGQTTEEASDVVEAKQREGYEGIRIIDPDGIETNTRYLRFALDSVRVEAA